MSNCVDFKLMSYPRHNFSLPCYNKHIILHSKTHKTTTENNLNTNLGYRANPYKIRLTKEKKPN